MPRSSFTAFSELSVEQVRDLIMESPSKSCSMDPIPTPLLKKCADTLAPVITKIINLSLTTGVVPESFKVAKVTPILKKKTLDKDIHKNYRPVSLLSFLSKLLERCCMFQIQDYFTSNSLYACAQSAYRQYHSTETALLRVNNDILRGIDHHNEAVLVLLDLSSAFDTIDHNTLLQRLRKRYGIAGTALKWFTSYLTGRSQSVIIEDCESKPHILVWGVPQGSVCGAPLFTYYTAPLSEIIERHGLSHVMYADDTQVYVIFEPHERASVIRRIEACIKDIKAWAVANKLQINDEKTEIIHFSSRFVDSDAPTAVAIGDSLIKPALEARNLGVVMDHHLNLKSHVSNICRTGWGLLYKLGQIRKYLDASTTERLIHAFISSRIDSCNSLLAALPDREFQKLQKLQNAAARLVTRSRRSEHITPVLKELHWLPVTQRVKYKVLLLIYKTLHGLAPTYLRELITRYVPKRTLRSSSQNLLCYPDPAPRTKYYGDRPFSMCGPSFWNRLPIGIKNAASTEQFKRSLKTYLFKEYFN